MMATKGGAITEGQSPLRYLKAQLDFTSREWLELGREHQLPGPAAHRTGFPAGPCHLIALVEDLRRWAQEEMQVLGIAVKPPSK